MPRPAVAVASASTGSTRARNAPDTELSARLTTLGTQLGHGRGLRPGRSQLLAIGLVILALWLVLVFGRALGQLNEATQREAAATSDAAALVVQLEAGRRELALVQTDAFQRLQARALGMGASGELVFTLTSDAAPPAVVPLGQGKATSVSPGPLEAWLDLLFGS